MKQFILKHIRPILFGAGVVVTMLAGMLIGTILVYQKGFPQIKNLEDIQPVVMTTLYNDLNQPLREFAIEKRAILRENEISEHLQQAVIAAEDQEFYNHWGINFKGAMRASWGVVSGRRLGGGSSITQQLSRALFLTPEISISRKLQEMLLAIQIERKYTKNQILTFYLNKIFLGGSVYGVEAASRHYFGKSAAEISLAEAALLAAIIPNPNGLFNMYRQPENCRRRRDMILKRLRQSGRINEEQLQQALKEAIPEKPFETERSVLADYFSEEVRKYLEAKYGDNLLYKGGLKVYTTLNSEMQQWAEEALQENLRNLDKRQGWRPNDRRLNLLESEQDLFEHRLPSWRNLRLEAGQIVEGVVLQVDARQAEIRIDAQRGILTAARARWTRRPLTTVCKKGDVILVRVISFDKENGQLELGLEQEPEVEGAILVIENNSGKIKAMVGGYSFERSKFNRAFQALRQTGSTFKPIVYTAALEHGFSPATIIEDAPFSYLDPWTGDLWEPKNHKGDYVGPITLRMGLEQSRNVVTARIMQIITPEIGVRYAKQFGITADLKPFLSLSLGAFEVTLREMTAAFTVFANGGLRVNPYFVNSIRDLNNNIFEENFPEKKQVIDRETAYVMNYILQGVVKSGTAWRARNLPTPLGGKTGTTNDFTDAWFIGFTPSLTIGVWIGHDQKRSLGIEETGSRAALPVFLSFMENYLAHHPESGAFTVPSTVIMVDIDKFTGKLLSSECLYPFREAFLPGSEPLQRCNEEEHFKFQKYFRSTSQDEDID